jgi:hypothetical protein
VSKKLVEHSCLLKIDAQGHEYEVLQGCESSLRAQALILVELSVDKLYEGEKDMLYLINWLRSNGFGLWSLAPVFADMNSYRILQYDGLFVNMDLVKS